MVDIHSHIIYGIDDGAKDIDMSIEMAKQAISKGINHIIATPHYNDFVDQNFFEVRDKRVEELNNYFVKKNMDLKIEAAAEVAFISDWDKILQEKRLLICDDYLLIEFPDLGLPEYTLDIIYKVKKNNIIPIIAHPERCRTLQDNMNYVNELIRLGCHFQADAGSFIGHFGSKTMKTANKFNQKKIYHFYGSDAHNTSTRSYLALDNKYFTSFNERLLSRDVLPELNISTLPEKSYFSRIIDLLRY